MSSTMLQTISPQAQALGFDPVLLERVARKVQSDIEGMRYDGARIMVARHGQTVLDLTVGYADRDKNRPLAHDAVFSVMSISKVMTAIALLQCEIGRAHV